MDTKNLDSHLLEFVVSRGYRPGDRLPALEQISAELGISVGKLREQLDSARRMGIVEVKPRTGIRLLEYTFGRSARSSLLFGLHIDPSNFESFSALRNSIEASFWHEAVARLGEAEKERLRDLLASAWAKLNGTPIQIPHVEHRNLHLTIFSRLGNPFVQGLLEAYWAGYEAVELDHFTDYAYLREVWTYHQRIVECIVSGDYDAGHTALIEHTGLIRYREQPSAMPPEGIQARAVPANS